MFYGLFDINARKYVCFYTTVDEAYAGLFALPHENREAEIHELQFGQPISHAKIIQTAVPSVNMENVFKFYSMCQYLNSEQREFLKELKSNSRCTYANISLVEGPWIEIFKLIAEKPLFTENAVSFNRLHIPDIL